jgi:WD40 repeat protein
MSVGNASLTEQAHYHVFLSHNGADKSLVEALANELENRGLSCWLDKWNLIPGKPWQPAIEEALAQCGICLVFFGPHGLGPWHNEEMRLALQRRVTSMERKLRVLPVILPGGQRAKESDLPGFLQGTTWVEFPQSVDDADALHRLLCGIKGIPPGRKPGATVRAGECPYLGLKTFQPEDAPLFFGRAAKVQELVDRLRSNFGTPKEERFLALIGASGSGKSSLALAGLIPAIQRGELPESSKWPLVRCRPGAHPWESLLIALAANQKIATYLAALPALIGRPEDDQRRLHLTARLALHDAPEAHRLFVLIDQFEEIFTLCNDEGARCQLIDNVLYATNVAEGRTIVALTMRADFYGQCANYTGLRAAIADHQSLIGPLSEQEVRYAIESPAHLAGGELEPGLMELLLADMTRQAGALPFLEHALFKLWERRDGRRLTAKAYTDTGRLQGALDAHAEEFFEKKLKEDEKLMCRQLLVDLVHPGEGAGDSKKRIALDDLAPTEARRAVLKKLADARLVTTDQENLPDGAQAELSHEALISGWRRLGDWVNENREKSRLKERLLDSAREWQRNDKKEDFLYRGAQLASVEEIFGTSGESLPKLGREFLEASSANLEREQEERQRQQQREIEAALAAEKRIRGVANQANVALARHLREAGKNALAVAYLAQALRLNPRSSGTAALTVEMLTQTSFPLLVTGAKCHGSAVITGQFSPDGQRLITVLENDTVRLWNATRGKSLGEPMKHGDRVSSARFSPDGQRVLTASLDGTARLWDAGTGKSLGEPMKHGDRVSSARFSPDGRQVLTASWDRTAQLWDAAKGRPIGQPMRHKGGQVVSACFSPDGQRVLTASLDWTARLWDAATGKALGEPMSHRDRVISARFSPDGRRVLTASWDGTAKLWDAATGKAVLDSDKIPRLPMKHGDRVSSARFSPDGQRVLTVSEDNTAWLWYAATGRAATREPLKHGGRVSSARFSPDGQRVLIILEDKPAQLWDAITGKALSERMKCGGRISSAQFSPDGQRVLITSGDTAQLWDAATGRALAEPMKQEGTVSWVQFSPDGQRMVTASTEGSVRFWEVATSKTVGRHESWFYSAQFSREDQRVTAASGDNTSCLWDVLTISDKENDEDVLLLADLAEATAGFALQNSGQADMPNLLSGDQINAARQIIAGRFSASSKNLTPLQRFLKWSTSDPRNRTISPFSELTVPEWVENMIKGGPVDSLRVAMDVDPSNARLAAHYGRRVADYALEKGTDPDVGRRARAEADFQTARAMRLAPDNDEVKKLRADVVQMLNLSELSQIYFKEWRESSFDKLRRVV